MPLTPRQKEVLDFLVDYLDKNTYSPSFEELAEGLGLASIATVHKHLTALESKGYLKRSFNQSRSVELGPSYYRDLRLQKQRTNETTARPPDVETPLLGTVAAGQPIESYSDPETISFGHFAGANDVFALKVRGDSMIEDHILEGDFVLVQKTDKVRNGDIVVALVDGAESTLKRFYDEGLQVRLQPANAALQPIFVDRSALQIQGKVLAVHRSYNA